MQAVASVPALASPSQDRREPAPQPYRQAPATLSHVHVCVAGLGGGTQRQVKTSHYLRVTGEH